MSRFVIDASVAVKWVVSEEGSDQADALLASGYSFLAPELIAAECANILWKKVRRGDLTADAAMVAARALELADVELRTMNSYVASATRVAIDLDHPAYDCFYLALAEIEGCPLVTADERLVRKLAAAVDGRVHVLSLTQAAERLARA